MLESSTLHNFNKPIYRARGNYNLLTNKAEPTSRIVIKIPEHTEWENIENIFNEYEIIIYTDGSKADSGLGAGVYSVNQQWIELTLSPWSTCINVQRINLLNKNNVENYVYMLRQSLFLKSSSIIHL